MRMGLVIYGELGMSSGGFLYDRFLVDALKSAGDTVDVISIPWPSWPAGVARGFDSALLSRLRAWDGDLLLQDELAHPTLVTVNRRLRHGRRGGRRPVPIVSIVHHLKQSERQGAVARAAVRRVERGYLDSVDAFIFNSRTTRRVVAGVIGREPAGVVASPGGDRLGDSATEADVEARSGSPGPLRILFAGSFIPRKGLHVLLEALSVLPRGTWHLTAAGSRTADPGYARRLDRLVASHRLTDHVDFPGHLDEPALAAALRAHHVLAMPSSYEGFGIIYLEAMGFGVVPIASRAGGGAEIVVDGRSGFLVRPESPTEITRILGSLSADRNRLRAAAVGALERSRYFPTWQASMAAAVSFLHTFRRG